MAFAAVVQVGPGGITFWGVWDRERRKLYQNTRRALPWRRPEVRMEESEVRIDAGEVALRMELAAGNPIESICPNGEGGYTWTRKLAGVPVSGEATLDGRSLPLLGFGVDDQSAGYHRRHTVWKWSAGVGVSAEGQTIGWNLVSGINDPAQNSERAIWIDGIPTEPGPVEFDQLDAIRLADGSRLGFTAETERVHTDRIPLVARSDYRAPFGSFRGSLGGVELESALGVMEAHDVLW